MRFLITASFFLLLLFPAEVTNAQLLTCTEGDECNFCELTQTLDNVVNWTVLVATLIAVIGLMYAGFRMSTSRGDVSTFTAAKEMLGNIVIGIFLIVAAWMIVDTILKTLAGGDLGVWNEIEQCGAGMFQPGVPETVLPLSQAQIRVIEGVDETEVSQFAGEHGTSPIPGVSNCSGSSASNMVGIPGEPGKYLREDAARNFIAMRAAAAADGITLRVTSAWRSQNTQIEIWNRHNCATNGCCAGTVAIPCGVTCGGRTGSGSNHNSGVAVDIAGSSRGTAIYNWLRANGGRFNFNNGLPNDLVHWSPSGR
tara:strand:- start:372 stop:1301 length:930 start_codon:yes stop_codon:yes gene_type:complete